MDKEPLALLPELVLLLGAVVVLLLGSFLPRRRQWVGRVLTAVVLLGSLGLTVAGLASSSPRMIYGDTYALDGPTTIARLVVPSAALLLLLLGGDELHAWARESETYVLTLLVSLGAIVLAGASDLSLLVVAFLLASVPLYGVIGLTREPRATEAALKTYLLGAFLGVAMLLGATLLFGVAAGTTYADLFVVLRQAPFAAVAVGLVLVLAGLLFKAGAVPGHFWVPDASQGASPYAAALLTTLPKVGGILAAYRLVAAMPDTVVDASLLLAVLAAATMTLGNLAAFGQDDARRLLGWSTVSQAGYLLMAVAVAGRTELALPALGLYLAAYAVTNLGAFAVTAAVPGLSTLVSYRGLAYRQPLLAGALLVTLLGLVGTPPTAVFAGKLTVFTAAWDGGFAWLVVVAAVNSVASLFYYLRWLAPVFDRRGRAGTPVTPPRPYARAAAGVAGFASVALGIGATVGLSADLVLLR